MDDYPLNVESFKKDSYIEKKEKIHVHKSLDMNMPIYHYLKLEYFLCILDNNRLYFSNREKLTDLREKGKKSNPKNVFRPTICQFNSESERKLHFEQQRILDSQIEVALNTCVSCWTYEETNKLPEDHLMWRAYGGHGIGIQIETKLGDLLDSFKNVQHDIVVNTVDYVKERAIYTVEEAIFMKDIAYKSERELRLCALCNEKQLEIDIEPEMFIHQIRLSPFISKQYATFLKNALESEYPYLKGKIKKSGILEY